MLDPIFQAGQSAHEYGQPRDSNPYPTIPSHLSFYRGWDDGWLSHIGLSKGDAVIKDSGDYTFEGVIVGIIDKLSGAKRYAVEDSRGLLFIFNAKQLRKVDENEQ